MLYKGLKMHRLEASSSTVRWSEITKWSLFPNARYLVERAEVDYVNSEQEAEEVEQWVQDSNRQVLSDSIQPVLGAGLVIGTHWPKPTAGGIVRDKRVLD